MLTSSSNSVESIRLIVEKSMSQAETLITTNPFYAGELCNKVIASYPAASEYSNLAAEDIALLYKAYTYQATVNVKLAHDAKELEAITRILVQLEKQLIGLAEAEINKYSLHVSKPEVKDYEHSLHKQKLSYNLIQHQQFLISLLSQEQILQQLQLDTNFLHNNPEHLKKYLHQLEISLVYQELELVKQKQYLLQQESKFGYSKAQKLEDEQHEIQGAQKEAHVLQIRLLQEQQRIQQIRCEELTLVQKQLVQKLEYLKEQQTYFSERQKLVKELLVKMEQLTLNVGAVASSLQELELLPAVPQSRYRLNQQAQNQVYTSIDETDEATLSTPRLE
jgi:hypothetical protein